MHKTPPKKTLHPSSQKARSPLLHTTGAHSTANPLLGRVASFNLQLATSEIHQASIQANRAIEERVREESQSISNKKKSRGEILICATAIHQVTANPCSRYLNSWVYLPNPHTPTSLLRCCLIGHEHCEIQTAQSFLHCSNPATPPLPLCRSLS